RPRLAPPRLPALLAVEGQHPPRRAPPTRRRGLPSNPTPGAGESDVGAPAHPGGARPARPPGLPADRRQGTSPGLPPPLAPPPAPLASFSCWPCRRVRRRALLPRPALALPPAVRLRRAPPRPPRTPPPQRDGPSDGHLDRPADHRGLPGGVGAALPAP